jgi:hypothetical protein
MCTQFNATTPEAIQAKCFPAAVNTTIPVTNATTTSSAAPSTNTTVPVTTNSTVSANSTDPVTTSSSVPLTTGSSTPVSVNATTTSSSVPLTTGSSNSTLGNSTYLPPPPFGNSTYLPPPPFLNSTTNSTLGNSTLPPFANFTLPVTNATNATVPDYTCMNTTTLRTLIPACALDCQAKALAATTCAFEDLECNCLQTGAIEAVLSSCLVTSANCTADEIDGISLNTPK